MATVVLVHGIDGSAETAAHIARHLFPKHQPLTYDLMGRGSDTSVPPSHSLQDYVDQLESQRLPRRFCLVGYSMGGAIAAAYALHHPKRVTSLVLLCPAGRVSNAGRLSASLPFPVWKLVVPRAILSTAAGQYNQRIMRQKRRLYADERFLRVLYGTLHEFPLHNLPLGRMSVPTIAIAADSDTIVPPEAVRRFAEECGAHFVVVRGTHAAPISSPRAIKRALDEWVRSRAGTSILPQVAHPEVVAPPKVAPKIKKNLRDGVNEEARKARGSEDSGRRRGYRPGASQYI